MRWLWDMDQRYDRTRWIVAVAFNAFIIGFLVGRFL